jgi:hypothetical protein
MPASIAHLQNLACRMSQELSMGSFCSRPVKNSNTTLYETYEFAPTTSLGVWTLVDNCLDFDVLIDEDPVCVGKRTVPGELHLLWRTSHRQGIGLRNSGGLSPFP